MKKFKITEEFKDERIDIFVTNNVEDYSRSQIQSMIKEGLITVNDESIKPNYRLENEDEIIFNEKDIVEFELKPIDYPIEVLYEDDYLAVVNKPIGLVVHPGAGEEEASLVTALMGMGMKLAESEDPLRPGIVHRLDKDTSGLLVVAKDSETLEQLQQQFKYREVVREYLTIVEGVVEHDFGTIDAPIGRDLHNRLKMGINPEGKAAVTYFDVLQRFPEHTLLKCRLESGRTHQIRVHMNYINHPIMGDQLYGIKKDYGVKEQLLYSYHMNFVHPITTEVIDVELPMRKDFSDLVDRWSEKHV